jgi:hypothetical protein
MVTESETADLFAAISPTSHPLVARYAITLVKGATITVDFGSTTANGRSTAPVPAPASIADRRWTCG